MDAARTLLTVTAALALAAGCGAPGADDAGESATTTGPSSDSDTDVETTSSTTSDEGTEGSTTDAPACELSSVGAVVPVGEGCCGCLCGSTGWSCAADTCLEADGTVATLGPEAGFFEVAPRAYVWAGQPGVSARSRIWYSFWPADTEPEARPLMLLFNGGPGASTGLLFGANTGPWSLDPQRSEGATPTADPWTRHFNLLYVDAPSTGFSYNLPRDDGTLAEVAIHADVDASAFVSVLLRFLARHPALQHNRVILLGESYGGTRGVLILQQLLEYEALIDGESVYQNEGVHGEIERHLAGLDPESCGAGVTRAQIAGQFGHLVSLQGVVAGLPQILEPGPPSPLCLPAGDPYHCDRPAEWLFGVLAEIAARLRTPALLGAALGVDPTTIAWMYADQRVGAYGREPVADEAAMAGIFGALGPSDAYYIDFNYAVQAPAAGSRNFWAEETADLFLRVIATVEALTTDARLDQVVAIQNLPGVLEARGDAVSAVSYDAAPRPGVERPGWFEVEYAPGWAPEGVSAREIRAPRYDHSGHAITLDESALLLADIKAWVDAGG
ncbi:MAG: hypothetical protein R3B09_28240 [Nannocystaceae bacterium]